MDEFADHRGRREGPRLLQQAVEGGIVRMAQRHQRGLAQGTQQPQRPGAQVTAQWTFDQPGKHLA